MDKIDDQMLKDMAQTIAQEVNPECIILFGSYARGDARQDSDVDLLVIEREPFGASRSRRREAARLWRALARFPVSKDIVLYSQGEVEHWRNSPNHLIARAMREGKILHARS